VSVDIFLGRPPLLTGMFSLLLEYIRLAEAGDIPSILAVSRVEKPSDMSPMASLTFVRVSGFMFCMSQGSLKSLAGATEERELKLRFKKDWH